MAGGETDRQTDRQRVGGGRRSEMQTELVSQPDTDGEKQREEVGRERGGGGRERDRQTDRQTETQRDRDTDTEREMHK